jgi:energy-coupling factor transport system permease protein
LPAKPLDPRAKLVAAFASTIVLMTLHHWPSLALAMIALLPMVLLLRLGRSWLGLLKGLGFAAVTFFIIAWLAFDLFEAIAAALRLLTIGTVFFLFFQSTSPEALSNSLIRMGVPYSFAFVLSASMEFVLVLIRRTVSIRDAQRARGIPLEGGLGILRHLPALAGPLLIQAFKLADELAEAMEARGFGAPGRRFRYEPQFRAVDWIVVMMSVAISGILIWVI